MHPDDYAKFYKKWESMLENKITCTEEFRIIHKIDKTIIPINDIRATADYRRLVLKNMLSYELAKII